MNPKWLRGVALLILFMALADLGIPGLCHTDELIVPSSGQRTAVSSLDTGARPAADDDCFCCCTHIVPAAHVQLAAGTIELPKSPALTERERPAYLPTPHHPPRS